jgi:hypothetical protein
MTIPLAQVLISRPGFEGEMTESQLFVRKRQGFSPFCSAPRLTLAISPLCSLSKRIWIERDSLSISRWSALLTAPELYQARRFGA